MPAWTKRRLRELRGQKRQSRDKRIRELHAQGKTQSAIARELGLCPKTVRRVQGKGATAKKRAPSKLDDYRAVVRHRALELGWQGRQIFKYVRELGYEGGETIVKNYVREIRPRPARRPALRFETEAGVHYELTAAMRSGVRQPPAMPRIHPDFCSDT